MDMNIESYRKLKEEYEEIRMARNFGLRILMARLKNLKDESTANGQEGLFMRITSRLKDFDSALQKCEDRGRPLSVEGLRTLDDIAGVRIITRYKDGIYAVRELIEKQPSVSIWRPDDDFVDTPRATGYRALHVNVDVEVCLPEETIQVPVEIQIRTPGMDFWAETEHGLRYKNGHPCPEAHAFFTQLSESLAKIDGTMMAMRDWDVEK